MAASQASESRLHGEEDDFAGLEGIGHCYSRTCETSLADGQAALRIRSLAGSWFQRPVLWRRRSSPSLIIESSCALVQIKVLPLCCLQSVANARPHIALS